MDSEIHIAQLNRGKAFKLTNGEVLKRVGKESRDHDAERGSFSLLPLPCRVSRNFACSESVLCIVADRYSVLKWTHTSIYPRKVVPSQKLQLYSLSEFVHSKPLPSRDGCTTQRACDQGLNDPVYSYVDDERHLTRVGPCPSWVQSRFMVALLFLWPWLKFVLALLWLCF